MSFYSNEKLCSLQDQCHKHVLFNVCTVFMIFLCQKNACSDILNTPLSKSFMTLGGLVIIQDYILNTFVFLEFRITSSSSSSSSSPSYSFCVHGFSKTTARIDLKLYITYSQTINALLIEISLTLINDLDLYSYKRTFTILVYISKCSLSNVFKFSDKIANTLS